MQNHVAKVRKQPTDAKIVRGGDPLIYKKKYIVVFLLFLLFSFDTYAGDTFTLTLLHTNDIHGRAVEFYHDEWGQMAGGFARIAALAQDQRRDNPHTLLFDAGDVFSGTAECSLSEGRIMLLGAAITGYDAIALGNHEFDYGRDVLAAYIEHSSVPLLSANTFWQSTGNPFAPGYAFFEINGVSIMVVGLTTPSTPTSSHPQNTVGLRFAQPEPIVRQLQETYGDRYDILVILSHLGLDADRQLAEAVPGIHVIVGGHSHSRLEHAIQIHDTIIAQAHQWGLYLGRIDLTIQNASIQSFAASLLPLDERVAPNPLVRSLLEDWLQPAAYDLLDETLATTAEPIARSAPWWVGDSALGNLFTDSLLWQTQADFAVYNNGGLRDDLAAGRITLRDLYRVEPFGSTIQTLKLSGHLVQQLFVHMARRGGDAVAGASYAVAGTAPQDVRIQGEPLDVGRTYTVAVSDFLAAGGSNYWMLPRGQVEQEHGLVRDGIAAFLLAHPDYEPAVDGRIRWQRP